MVFDMKTKKENEMRVLINRLSVILYRRKTLFEGLIVIREMVCQSPQISLVFGRPYYQKRGGLP